MTGAQASTAEMTAREAEHPGKGEARQVSHIRSALQQTPKVVTGGLLLLLTLVIGWADQATSAEVSLFIFYALPIALSVWLLGNKSGVACAVLAALVWWIANRTIGWYETEAGYFWAMMNRFFYFGFVVLAVAAVRTKQQADAARIQALEERRQLEHELIRISEHEQQRIGQDLHDGLCQRLAAIGCATRMLSDDLKARDLAEAEDASMIEAAIQDAILEARNLARGIFPVHVDRDSLSAAISDLATSMNRLTGVSIEVCECEQEVDIEPRVTMHLYRIAQEAVANAVRHGEASKVRIVLEVLPGDELELRVEDNGKGLPRSPGRKGRGMGLNTMRYRADAVGGNLKITSRPAGGTVVSCRLTMPGTVSLEENDDENQGKDRE